MKLWLDDVRPAPAGWVWVRTAAQCIEMLRLGIVSDLSLDHDLGFDDVDKNGKAVANWLERAVVCHNFAPPVRMHCHSMNPSGKASIMCVINRVVDMVHRNGLPVVTDPLEGYDQQDSERTEGGSE
jgi:hypothetical protein